MKIPKLKMPFMVLPTCMLPLTMTTSDPALLVGWFVYQFVWLVWAVASFLADGEFIGSGMSRAQKRRELWTRQVRELEKELGFEPLDMDWPEPLLDEIRERQKKEKP
jgi:hypothetical protein